MNTGFLGQTRLTRPVPPPPPSRKPPKEKRPWLVISGPDNDLSGRAFRTTDVRYAFPGIFPVGTVFRNTNTGDYKVWQGEKFVLVKSFFLDLDGIRAGRYMTRKEKNQAVQHV